MGDLDLQQIYSKEFYTQKASQHYKNVKSSYFVVEKVIVPKTFERKVLITVLNDINLIKTVKSLRISILTLFTSFIVIVENSGGFHNVYVRNQLVKLLLYVINKFEVEYTNFDSLYPTRHRVDFEEIAQVFTKYKLDK